MANVVPALKKQITSIKPGEFFIRVQGGVVIYAFASEPPQPDHAPTWLTVHHPATSEYNGRLAGRLELGQGAVALQGVEVRYEESDIQYSNHEMIPPGSIVLEANGPALLARRGQWDVVLVSLENGAISHSEAWQSFWIPRWKLVRPVPNEEPITIFEFQPPAVADEG